MRDAPKIIREYVQAAKGAQFDRAAELLNNYALTLEDLDRVTKDAERYLTIRDSGQFKIILKQEGSHIEGEQVVPNHWQIFGRAELDKEVDRITKP